MSQYEIERQVRCGTSTVKCQRVRCQGSFGQPSLVIKEKEKENSQKQAPLLLWSSHAKSPKITIMID